MRILAIVGLMAVAFGQSNALPVPRHMPSVSTGAACISPDSAALDFRDFLVRTIAGASEEDSVERATWQVAATLDTSAVQFVSDSAACSKAAVVHAAAAGADTAAPEPVYLLRVSPERLIAFNFTPVGEFTLFALLDQELNLLERLFG